MAAPLVYVDTSEVREGAAESIRPAIEELVAFLEANEPDLLGYGVYLSDDGTRMTVVHVHTDSASLEHHLEVGGPAFRPFVDLITLRSIDLYGEPSETAVKQLLEKARMLGTGEVTVHPPAGGFERFG
ncbi:MAG TPA: antibiotic biosynthesis monooxygenase [Solirubrobacterales bacterium]|nr:antibiotic biosynthesis monooxygenase [Solirubrobacterales bacterium]